MTQPHVVDQYRDIQSLHHPLQAGIVSVVASLGGEIDGEGFDGGVEFGLDFCGEGVEFRRRARDEDGAVARAGKVEGEFAADAVRCTGYEGPGFGGGPECAELRRGVSVDCLEMVG